MDVSKNACWGSLARYSYLFPNYCNFLLQDGAVVNVTVQDALLSKTASVSTSCSKTTGSSRSPCLMYEPTTPPKYGSLNGTCQNIPCSIQEDYSSYDETTPSPKTSRWRCGEDDTPGTVLNVMGSEVFSQLTIPWYRSTNSVCPPMKGDCGWARWTKDWFCSIVHKGFLDYTSSVCQSALRKATVFERDEPKNWSTAVWSPRPFSTKCLWLSKLSAGNDPLVAELSLSALV